MCTVYQNRRQNADNQDIKSGVERNQIGSFPRRCFGNVAYHVRVNDDAKVLQGVIRCRG